VKVVMTFALLMVGVGILAISARIQVPFYPVPVTMQTLAGDGYCNGLWQQAWQRNLV
jgi:hypothetical protein